jgi:hypothetical protein
MGQILKVKNMCQADLHLTPPVPPPSAPGEPLVPALAKVILARCTGTPGLPDFKPSITEVPSETILSVCADPVVRAWFTTEGKCEIVGSEFPPASAAVLPGGVRPGQAARENATAARARQDENDRLSQENDRLQAENDRLAKLKAENERLTKLLEAATAPPAKTGGA